MLDLILRNIRWVRIEMEMALEEDCSDAQFAYFLGMMWTDPPE